MGMVDKRAGKNLCKRKFVVKKVCMDSFPATYRDFVVHHTYIRSSSSDQAQIVCTSQNETIPEKNYNFFYRFFCFSMSQMYYLFLMFFYI